MGGLLSLAIAVGGPVARAHANPSDEEIQKQQELEQTQTELTAEGAKRDALRDQSRAISADLEGLQEQMVVAGRSARENELALTGLENDLAKLTIEHRRKLGEIVAQRAELSVLLEAFQRLAIHPPQAMVVLPQPPQDTVRSAMLMALTVPRINDQIQVLRVQMDELMRVEADIARQRNLIKSASGKLRQQRRLLTKLITRKAALERSISVAGDEAATRADALLATAKELKDLLDHLAAVREAAERRQAEATRQAREAARQAALAPSQTEEKTQPQLKPASGPLAQLSPRGARTLPAAGHVLTNYGQEGDLGMAARGISIETRPGGIVVAPFAGHVVFAGPFRGYGQILIIEHADGYHSLLAGLGRIDSSVGQYVATGEPIGQMDTDSEQNPVLYFELRRNGQPIDPQPWLAAEHVR